MRLAIELYPVTGLELAPPLGFLKAVDAHLSALDALLGLAAGKDQAFPLQELIEANRFGRRRRSAQKKR